MSALFAVVEMAGYFFVVVGGVCELVAFAAFAPGDHLTGHITALVAPIAILLGVAAIYTARRASIAASQTE